MDCISVAGAMAAIAAGVLAPGALAAAWLDVGRGPLERFVLALAFGILALAAASLLLVSTLGSEWLRPVAALALIAALLWAWRSRRTPGMTVPARPPWAAIGAILVTLLAAALLVHAEVGRSGLPGPDGALVFYDDASSNDGLVYASVAQRLATAGLPLRYPFTGDHTTTAHYVFYGVLVGLHALSGATLLDVVFRIAPFFYAASIGLAALALVRALGGSWLGASCAGVLSLLGTGAPHLVPSLGWLVGRELPLFAPWQYAFGPWPLAINPLGAALLLLFAGCLVLTRLEPGLRREAIVAGVLFAAVFEAKVFLWAPLVTALVLLAAWRTVRAPNDPLAAPLRLCLVTTGIASLPSFVEKLLWAARLAEREATGIGACLGCLPRYFLHGSLGQSELAYGSFLGPLGLDGLQAALLGSTLLGVGALLTLGIGARWLALGVVRRDLAPAGALVVQLVALSALVGLVAACTFAPRPHGSNSVQLAWSASFGLWPLVGLAVGHWLHERRALPLLVLGLLWVPAVTDFLDRVGYGAPGHIQVSREEQRVIGRVAELTAPDDVIFEPSLLANPQRPSMLPPLAGRPVYLGLGSAASVLVPRERETRRRQLRAVFEGSDAERAAAALRESRVAYLLVPPSWAPPSGIHHTLPIVMREGGATLHRVTLDGARR